MNSHKDAACRFFFIWLLTQFKGKNEWQEGKEKTKRKENRHKKNKWHRHSGSARLHFSVWLKKEDNGITLKSHSATCFCFFLASHSQFIPCITLASFDLANQQSFLNSGKNKWGKERFSSLKNNKNI